MGAYVRAVECVPPRRTHPLVRVIRAEFHEMPGMRLTRVQFRRLWNLGQEECDAIIRALLDEDYLAEGADGRVGRRADQM